MYNENTDLDSFIDIVLDNINKYAQSDIFEYYNKNRDKIAEYDINEEPLDVAIDLIDNFDNNDIKDLDFLDELFRSDDMIKKPTGADGQWVSDNTKFFIISKAISKNDTETLLDFIENGIPSSDPDIDDNVDFFDQYHNEFEEDYALLTKELAYRGKDINDTLQIMLDTIDTFIVSPFDFYNLFASSKTDLLILYRLAENQCQLDNTVIFYANITISDIKEYLKKKI